MSDENNSGWISQGTPRDDEGWDVEPDEYGTAVEWDDHASEQSVPVAPPRPRPTAAPEEASEEPTQVMRSGSQALQDAPNPEPEETAQQVDAAAEVDPVTQSNLDSGSPAGDQIAGADFVTETPVSESVAEESVESQPSEDHDATSPVETISEAEPTAADQIGSDQLGTDAAVDQPAAAPESSGYASPEHLAWLRLANPPAETPQDSSTAPVTQESPPADPPEALQESPAPDPLPSQTEPGPDLPAAAGPSDADPNSEAPAPEDTLSEVPEEPVGQDPDQTEEPSAVPQRAESVPIEDDYATDSPETDDDAPSEPPADAATDNPYATDAAAGWEQDHAADVPDDLYRTGAEAEVPQDDPVAQQPDVADVEAEEEARVAAQLAAERAARAARLGQVSTSTENEVRALPKRERRVTDKPMGSLALLLIRLVTAANLGVVSYKILTDVDATTEYLARTVLPEPRLVAWILGFTLGAMAVLLVIGLLQRVVGFLLFALGIGSLIVVRWGSFNPFAGQEAFAGDKDLLLIGIGFLLLALGGGKISIDGAVRSHWQKSRSNEDD